MYDQLERTLIQEVDAEIRFDEASRAIYSTDASIYQIKPVGVIIPRTTEAVSRAVALVVQHGCAVVPRGAGTSLSGQTVGDAVVIDCSKYLNRIVSIDPDRRVAKVQPGVVLDQLNTAASAFGLQFGPDVATSDRANLGGMIGNNSAGSRSIVYGKTIDHVRKLDVVLSDGTCARWEPLGKTERAVKELQPTLEGRIYRQLKRIVESNREEIRARYPQILRRVSGYNLDAFVSGCQDPSLLPPGARSVWERHCSEFGEDVFNVSHLITGSEGTLATITEAEVDLIDLPPFRGLVALHFSTLTHAIDAVETIIECQPSAVELIDQLIIQLASRSFQYRSYLDFVVGTPEALLIVEFSGDNSSGVEDEIKNLENRLYQTPGLDTIVRAVEAEKRDHIWRCRKAGVPLLLSIPGARKPVAFVEDTAVNPAQLPEFVSRFRAILKQFGTEGAFYGHASVGCLHIRPMLDLTKHTEVDLLSAISEAVCDLVIEFGGSLSGEHGDGLARSHWNEKLFGTQLYRAFCEIKEAFDPHGHMNPGKIVKSPTPSENLRWAPPMPDAKVKTSYDFQRQAGFLGAAEACNGSGVCRKTNQGTMCPSYMATREEEHSTRGRANALRLALTGKFSDAGWTSHRMYEVFDLCLMCKACKSECPSGVDVGKLKSEFLSHYYQEHGIPGEVRFMTQVPWINRIGSMLAPWSNRVVDLPITRWMNEKLWKIDRRRSMPPFVHDHFNKWFARHVKNRNAGSHNAMHVLSPSGKNESVLLLNDCLTSYTEPGINQAAVELLEAFGFRVELANLWCCGRPLVSKGLLEEAKQLIRKNVRHLLDRMEQGMHLVGCEPSCLLTLVDEYPELLPGPETDKLAGSISMLDEWLVTRWQQAFDSDVNPLHSMQDREQTVHPVPPVFQKTNQTALFHGHCQQKALVGTAATRTMLNWLPGITVYEPDAGCCGMAGSFGYEKDHYDISQRIGGRVLFPAIESHQGPILAPGFSCRHQIHDHQGQRAIHPIEFVRDHLVRHSGDTTAS